MKSIFKNSLLIILCLVMVLSVTGCGNQKGLVEVPIYNEEHEKKILDTGVYASNEQFDLKWDKENLRIALVDKINNLEYSSTPKDIVDNQAALVESGKVIHPKLNTTLIIEYVKLEDYTVHTANGYVQSLQNRSAFMEKIDNGFRITYYFDTLQISVPVEYTLLSDGIKMSVISEDITEGGDNMIYRAHIAPFFVSTPIIDEDSYLFYPSGSGTIIEANNSDEISTYFSDDVYGKDGIVSDYSNVITSNEEVIRMPVYGAKNGNNGMLAIISGGAENATIEGDVGNNTIGYSALYTAFYVRGANQAKKIGLQYSQHIAHTPMSVSFYPLVAEEGDSVTYVDMANRYRKYLIEDMGMIDKTDKTSVSISLVGGTELETSFLGIPTTDVFATTTVEQAQTILTDLNSSLNVPIVADLYGFGESGLDIGKPAGNLKIAKNIGSEKQVRTLAEKCKELGIDLYFDYDLIHFDTNGQGRTITTGGAAKGPGLVYTRWYYYSLGTGNRFTYTYLLGRNELAGLAADAVKHSASMNVSGISFRKLTSIAYSDFAYNRSIAKANMGIDVSNILKDVTASGLKVLANQANDYAAINSDAIIDIPITSSMLGVFDYDVPFYQIVFKGYNTMYGASVNMATNRDLVVLRSIEGGAALKYTLTNNYDVDLLTSSYQIFNSLLYSDNKDEIIETVNATADYYKTIEDAHIINHTVVNDDVRRIEYDNGTIVYVNYGEEVYVAADISAEVLPESYSYGKGVSQ